MEYLHKIKSPKSLKELKLSELNCYCEEVRRHLIDVCYQNGGHLASNLGVVELTTAIHYVFNSPTDKIIFDVGHQCYTHKLITGRNIEQIRTGEQISGFPRICESEHDVFGTGHSSTSLSAAAGIAHARDLNNQSFQVVAVIGDAALTGGMALEALNNIGADQRQMLIILNDNKMSISKNVGAMSKYLSKFRLNRGYIGFKRGFKKGVLAIPLIGKGLVKGFERTKRFFKFAFVSNKLFEQLGIKYIGAIDGHNLGDLIAILKSCQNEKKPILLHVITQKGRGFMDAEQSPQDFHGISTKLDCKEGESSFSLCMGQTLCELAKENDKIVAVTAAMPQGTGLEQFKQEFSPRFFDVGIAEQHAAAFCAGLATQGIKPYFAVYSTFLQRAYDQVVHDICLQNLPVTIMIDRGGIVGFDGATHQGVFDLSYLRHIPNLTIMSPKDTNELKQMMRFSASFDRPLAIRYPKSTCLSLNQCAPIELGKWEVLKNGQDAEVVALCVGDRMIELALRAAELAKKSVCVVNARFIKPLDSEFLSALKQTQKIITMEDNAIMGGFGSAVLEFYANSGLSMNVVPMGIVDKFINHGNPYAILEGLGFSEQALLREIEK